MLMKRIVGIVVGVVAAAGMLLVSGCGTMRMSPEEKQRVAEQVQQKLDAREYTIEINYMMPLRGGGRAITGDYSIEVSGDKIDSFLPYAGAARNVPYGGGKALIFKDDIDEYADSGFIKDRRTIVFTTDNDEDNLTYRLTIFEDGQATVQVHCTNRDDISFRGVLNPDAKTE